VNGYDIPEDATAPGYCHRCDKWTPRGRIVAEVHSDSGAGHTVVRCTGCCSTPHRTVRATEPRRYQL
jgi:hypothetical protein